MAEKANVVLSKAQREVIIEALELKQKSHERAARASAGAVSEAHKSAADAVWKLIGDLRQFVLEF